MAKRNPASTAKAVATKKQGEALELRRAGHGYAAISRKLRIALSTAHKYVNLALQEAIDQVNEDADQLRAEDISRLDGLLIGIWPKASNGDAMAIDRVLRIMERRAKLLGLDAPTKVGLGRDPDALPLTGLLTMDDATLERIASSGR